MSIHNPMHFPSAMKKVQQINNKYATLVLQEDTVRKLARLDLPADDRQMVEQALEIFRLEHLRDEAYGMNLVEIDPQAYDAERVEVLEGDEDAA